jgi:glycosyltransferase involved in cell wall biosynthesis
MEAVLKILFVAPLPPPINGHSVASDVFLNYLQKTHETTIINLGKSSLHDGTITVGRIKAIGKILLDVWRENKSAGAIYLTISESFSGNVKDLLIYLICWQSLSRMYIHLHGGSLKRLLLDRHKLLYHVNTFFIKRLAGVIVTGNSHVDAFAGMIDPKRVHVVPNFAQDDLFVTEQAIENKFADFSSLNILYISAMVTKKGYEELSEAYLRLSGSLKWRYRLDFAGKFPSEFQHKLFLQKIAGVDRIHYHGIVEGVRKKRLLAQAHIFCLPTQLLEGQPISILEAYAAGCVVLTTGQTGIRDVFQDGVNGFEIQEKNAKSIQAVLEGIINIPEQIKQIALSNRKTAEGYRTARFCSALEKIIAAHEYFLGV